MGKVPVFGFALAPDRRLGARGRTYKLKLATTAANQPVMNLETRKVEITPRIMASRWTGLAQFQRSCLNPHEFERPDARGPAPQVLALFSVQYHPEASPGPHDSAYLFTRFAKMMEEFKR